MEHEPTTASISTIVLYHPSFWQHDPLEEGANTYLATMLRYLRPTQTKLFCWVEKQSKKLSGQGTLKGIELQNF